jgi:NADH:ubiquinone oxidoreductase subunit E
MMRSHDKVTTLNDASAPDRLQHALDRANTEDHQGASLVIPLLQEVQKEYGYVPEEAIYAIEQMSGVSATEIFGVLTFYAQFRLTPQGKHVIHVCRGTACHVRGAVGVRRALERVLGIKAGGTTPDMEYSLETVACIGACALAPTIVVDDHVYGQMDTKRVEEMFADYHGGAND